ncbi:MAG: serine protease [Bacteroides sp. SM23_62]|nr:MAG: serine protease [Bacteroides sp. SM23_62]
MKKLIRMLVPSIIGSGLTIAVFLLTGLNHSNTPVFHAGQDIVPVHKTIYTVKENGEFVPLDFTGVSKEVMNSVVHIKSIRKVQGSNQYFFNERSPFGDMFGDEFFRFFYGEPKPQNPGRSKPEPFEQIGTGSGVIISSNGYIVTNNHVVDQADDIEITLHNNDSYKAKVIGTDPSTDLALLQIKKDGLPAMHVGNSDQVEVGEWVMAVGNPFNLNSTVTAGIVSAKGRNINIIDDKSAIEAFIQTDAAINPGNSGGALVNLNGELIGINTAIASPTGAYAGYGFAIPANIVSKVVEDFMKYGMVQRAYLGIMIRDINGDLMKDKHLKISEGAFVDSITEKSAAGQAGIKTGDVVVSVDNVPIEKSADLLEQIGRHRPGDQVSVTVNRNGKELSYNITLANQKGSRKLISSDQQDILDILGASFETLDKDKADQLGIEGGVIVKELNGGILENQTGISEGFIITGINNEKITTVDDLRKALKHQKGGVMLEGIYENYPGVLFYAFGLPD